MDNTNTTFNEKALLATVSDHVRAIPFQFEKIFLSFVEKQDPPCQLESPIKQTFFLKKVQNLYIQSMEFSTFKNRKKQLAQTQDYLTGDHRLLFIHLKSTVEDVEILEAIEGFVQQLLLAQWQNVVVQNSELEKTLIKVVTIYTQGYQQKEHIPFHYKTKV